MKANNNRKLNKQLHEALDKVYSEQMWAETYAQWRENPENGYHTLLSIKDPFSLNNAGDSISLTDDIESQIFFDNLCMAAYFSNAMSKYIKDIIHMIYSERNPSVKIQILEKYFEFVDECKNDQALASVIGILYNAAKEQSVLQGKHSIDLQIAYIQLYEIYRMYSVEAIYLRFSYWRLQQKKSSLRILLSSIIEYVKTYFYAYNEDPDIRLDYNTEGLTNIKKLLILQHWFKHITFHTKGIFDEYKKREWLLPIDQLVDEFILINQITKFEMLRYASVFSGNDEKTIVQKANCNHSYGVWIKTTDIVTILCDITERLYHSSDETIKKMYSSKKELLDLYDNMLKIKDEYTNIVFDHRAYYQSERRQFNQQVLDAQEQDALLIGQSIDDVLQLTKGFLSDDIDELMQAKQKYISHLSIFMSDDQEQMIDEMMDKIVDKIKRTVRDLNIYENMYEAISEDFKAYAQYFYKYPDIFCSLVSAEYLYKKYVEGKSPNDRFDYSCISIMYYKALEDFTNQLVYAPYAINVLDPNKKKVRNEFEKYISHPSKFWDRRNRCYKKTVEIGVLGKLFLNLNTETEFVSFLKRRFEFVNVEKLINYGSKLERIAPRRNEAAHGGNLVTYDDAFNDKKEVYNTVDEYRGLIMELFDVLF